jgi:hypothetical protein
MRPTLVSLVLLLLSSLSFADVVRVTNTADSGPGSLRAAIEAVNDGTCRATCIVHFNIAGPVPPSGFFTIRPQSLLPIVRNTSVYIDGTTQTRFSGDTNPYGPEVEIDGTNAGWGPGLKLSDIQSGAVAGLAIHSFEGNGVVLERGAAVGVFSSYLGVDPTGTVAKPNGMNGVLVAGTNTPTISSNVIGGNRGNGIFIFNSNAHIYFNSVGMGRTAGYVLGNGANGIEVHGRGAFVEANRVAFNRDHGIVVDGLAVKLGANEIWANRYLSIDLGNDGPDANDELDADMGPNARQNKPAITFARAEAANELKFPGNVTVRGTIHSKPHHGIEIDVFASPYRNDLGLPEGRVYLGRTRTATDAEGNATWEFDVEQSIYDPTPVLIPGGYVVATAITADGTSEMSDAHPLEFDAYVVSTTADAGSGSLRATIEAVNAARCTDAAPCWISFRIPDAELQPNGAARFTPKSPLPALTNSHVYLDGWSQTYWTGERVLDDPEVEIAGETLRLGTAETPLRAVLLRGITVSGARGDGLVVHAVEAQSVSQQRVVLMDLLLRDNEGNGITIHGGDRTSDFFAVSPHLLLRVVARGNRGNGLLLDGHGFHIGTSRFERNGGAGLLAGGELNRVFGTTAAHNGGAGFASTAAARALYLEQISTVANGGLGIDRNDDGVTGADPHVTEAPVVLSATYDAATNTTTVRGRAPLTVADVPMPQGRSGLEHTIRLWAARTPDPSGHGEGEFTVGGTTPAANGEWEARIVADLRGLHLSATRTLSPCYWEFGCAGRDTSEYSNAVMVE